MKNNILNNINNQFPSYIAMYTSFKSNKVLKNSKVG